MFVCEEERKGWMHGDREEERARSLKYMTVSRVFQRANAWGRERRGGREREKERGANNHDLKMIV